MKKAREIQFAHLLGLIHELRGYQRTAIKSSDIIRKQRMVERQIDALLVNYGYPE